LLWGALILAQPPGPSLTIGQYSVAGRKEPNEDSYGIVIPKGNLLQTKGVAMAIADGVSASQAGKVASETCVKSFLDDYYGTHESWTVKKSVASLMCAVNQWLYRQGRAQFAVDGALATTFSGIILKAGMAHVFHVGDSRVSLLRDLTLEPLTRDHYVHTGPQQGYLSRAFGIEPVLEIDHRKLSVEPGDIFIFTTDGVHEHLTPKDIQNLISGHCDDLQVAAENIVASAFENNSPDNLTCQLVRIDDIGTIDEKTHLEKLQALPFPPDLAPGMMFEGYRIESEMHASNRTQVYVARDDDADQQVILKTPSVNFVDDPAYIEMFMREEWAGKRIQSPNVVRVLAPKVSRSYLYYVTEYVDGQTLESWMENKPNPDLVEVRGIADQIASGLRAFHRKDMIHQDLKPGNVVIDKHGTVKLIDFGSTGVASLDELNLPVKRPSLVGTVDYTAPEYHLGVKPTNRSDIYSLGVIVFQMLTGKLPYGQGFANEKSVGTLELTPAATYTQSLPYWVSEALSKAVQRDPEKRYDALSAFMADLARPNPEFTQPGAAPMLQRNPNAFWKAVALASLFINLALLVLLSR